MTMSDREHAIALLDVLGVGTPGSDQVAGHQKRAGALRSCFRGVASFSASALVNGLEGDMIGADDPSKRARFPLDHLRWVLADIPGPGERLSSTHLNTKAPALDEVVEWWKRAKACVDADIKRALEDGDEERVATLRRRVKGLLPRGTLVLSSDTGVGKSVAAVYMARKNGGVFLRAAEIGEIGLGKGEALLAYLASIPFLIIDELGRENTIGATPQRMTELLSLRHDNGRTTLITTQLKKLADSPGRTSEDSFGDRYGHHLVDRIEGGGGGWIDLPETSLRYPKVTPRLDQIRRSARIADLVESVRELTGRGDHTNVSAIARLQAVMGVSDEAVAAAHASRKKWMAELREQASAIGGTPGSVLEDILNG